MSYGQPITEIPLKPAVFHILLALSSGRLHGLGIADTVESETAGEIRLGPGTLYRALKNMVEAGIVTPAEDPAGPHSRRKYYRLTAAGGSLLQAEAERLARIVEIAQRRRVILT